MDLLTKLHDQLEFLLDNKDKFTDFQILSITNRIIDKYRDEYTNDDIDTEDETEDEDEDEEYTTNIHELLEDYDYKNYYGFIKVQIIGDNYRQKNK